MCCVSGILVIYQGTNPSTKDVNPEVGNLDTRKDSSGARTNPRAHKILIFVATNWSILEPVFFAGCSYV